MSGLSGQLAAAVDAGLAFLRRVDPHAAAELDALRRRELGTPSFVLVGETKRGKSALVNALVGVPDLCPVDAAVATAAYLELVHSPAHAARAYLPGRDEPVQLGLADLRDWGTVAGRLPDGMRPPWRIVVQHSAPLLQYLSLVDTPGTGGLDAAHVAVALDAVERASALVFVADAGAPLAQPELDFLVEAGKRVNLVLFALNKIDVCPGWRTVLADNKALLQAHAPRFGTAAWFPVSARLAELALTAGGPPPGELVAGSRIADLQHALIELSGRGHALAQANVLRALRSEVVRLDLALADRIRAAEADPAEAERATRERAAVAARKRTESRQWSLALTTETQRARVEATSRLRQYLSGLQEEFLGRIDRGGRDEIRALPHEVDRALQALSVRLSHDLEHRFQTVAEQTLARVFSAEQLQYVLGQLNVTLRYALGTRPRRDGGGGPDHVMIAISAGGMAFMAGRGAMVGVSALGAGALAGAGVLVPFAGIGLGLAAGAFILYRRRVATDRQQARSWLREVVGEARAALGEEVLHRFTDLQYALTLALDEAIERRLRQLDEHLAEIDKAVAANRASRARTRAAVQQQRDALRAKVRQFDEVLVRARQLAPAGAGGIRDEPA